MLLPRFALVLGWCALGAGCVAATHTPSAFPGAPPASPSRRGALDAPADLSAQEVVLSALALRGVPYRLGGDTPDRGLDCSGLVSYVFARHGLQLPRTVAEQYSAGRRIRPAEVRPGDLVFFSTTGRGATHVGIATSVAGEFVHAPGTGGVARRSDRSGWWRWSATAC